LRRFGDSIVAEKTDCASWDAKSWPTGVWPNCTKRARWILRTHRPELIECGAVSRIGKTLIILAPGYSRFLRRHVGDVPDFQSNLPNARRAA